MGFIRRATDILNPFSFIYQSWPSQFVLESVAALIIIINWYVVPFILSFFIQYIESIPVAVEHFQVHAVPPVMLVPQIWMKKESSNLLQVGFLLEIQVIATYLEDMRLSALWWPYGRSVIGAKLQVFYLPLIINFIYF